MKDSEKIAFRMKLKEGSEDEYKRRHDELWPDLKELLRNAGIRDYSIHLDEESGALYGVLWRSKDHGMDELANHPVMRKWWDHMADIMEVNDDNSPKVEHLRMMFHLE